MICLISLWNCTFKMFLLVKWHLKHILVKKSCNTEGCKVKSFPYPHPHPPIQFLSLGLTTLNSMTDISFLMLFFAHVQIDSFKSTLNLTNHIVLYLFFSLNSKWGFFQVTTRLLLPSFITLTLMMKLVPYLVHFPINRWLYCISVFFFSFCHCKSYWVYSSTFIYGL